MRLARSLVAATIVVSALIVADAGPAAATTCATTTASTYRYTRSAMSFGFAIRLCDDRPSIGFGAEGFRTDSSGDGVGLAADGVARCSHRVCVVRGFGFAHGQEVARYEANVFWGAVADDGVGPVLCVTSPTRSDCQSPP